MQDNISHQLKNIASKSKTDDIYIIGKGPSIDELGRVPSLDGVVININDAERIYPGDMGIFSANWVRHSLAESGFRCSFYLAGKPLPASVSHELLPPLPLEIDEEELTVYRLGLPELYDESLVLLTALKACRQIAAIRGRPQTVYLLGLDFSTQHGALSTKIRQDFTGSSLDEREAIVHAQEYHFRQFLSYLHNQGSLRLVHVGHRDFSHQTPAEFLGQFRTSSHATSPTPTPTKSTSQRVQIVAELTNNHLGDRFRLVEMIERAKEAGADLIKVQKRDVETFYTPEQLKSPYWSPFGQTLGDYRRGVELNDELLDILDETCRRCEIEWFSSVLDYQSYQALQRFDLKLLKIPSTISNHRDFHAQLAAEYHGPLVISTGYTAPDYLNYVLDTFANNEQIYLLHCVSAYPTPHHDCNIAVIQTYVELARQHPKIIPGYSSHDLGPQGCMLAVACGARMLEKHVKLGDVEWVHFDKVALDLKANDFANFVTSVRMAEEALGNREKRILECEHHKYMPFNSSPT